MPGFERTVLQLYRIESFCLLAQPVPVFLEVGGIHHQQVAVWREPVVQEIVYYSSLGVGEVAVLHATIGKGCGIVAYYPLQELYGLLPLHPDFAHVRYVEHPHAVPYGEVLVIDPGVLNGHVVARKLGHFRPEGYVAAVQWCLFHGVVKSLGAAIGVASPCVALWFCGKAGAVRCWA